MPWCRQRFRAVFLAVFLAVFFAGVFFVGVFFTAFFAAVFLAGAFLAVFFAAVFLAGAFFAAFFAVFLAADADFVAVFFAAAAVRLAAAIGRDSAATFGSFLAPETIAFRSAPALNFGTCVRRDFIRCPVAGLRTQRASRTRFSNEPKPVMATFSPFATSRVIVSSTDSSACAAAFLLPS